MTVDRTILQHLNEQTVPLPDGMAALPYSIHRTPEIRDWVTIESVALPPIPVWRSDRWGLVALIAVPVRSEQKITGWRTPWGAIEWSLPDCQVVQTFDLSQQPEFTDLASADPVLSTAADARSIAQREADLFKALDDFFTAPSLDRLPTLTPFYSQLLPSAFYSCYHVLIPDSRLWLIPDAITNAMTEAITESVFPVSPSTPDPIQLAAWLRQGRSLAEGFALPGMVAEFAQLEQRRRRPGFRLAIVGEFSRGKSTLINRLLEREVLPVGAVPTTATLTAILPDTVDEMQVNPGLPQVETRPLALSSWNDLLAVDPSGHDREVLTPVRIMLDHAWLRSLDVELIDTPGAGDLSEQRAALITDLLSQCDAAVLVVSGTLPFSLTEKSFLEEKVIGQHVPQLLVVVSKLDTIDLEERAAVFRTLQERIAQVPPAIPILPAHPIDAATSETEILAAIRRQIELMAAQDDRRDWRDRQIAGQLTDCLHQMAKIGTEAVAATSLNRAEQQCQLQQLESELQSADLTWEQLRLTLDQRRLKRDQQLRLHILEVRQELLEGLKLELERTLEPKVWWQRDLPFRVRRELLTVSRKSEEFLLKAIAQDVEWLDSELSQAFAARFSYSPETAIGKLEIQPDYGQLTLTDTKRYRLLTRLGCSGGVLCGYLFGGPIGIITSTGIWFLGEQLLSKEVESQRHFLMQELDRCLGNAINIYCSAVSDRLRQLYRQIADDTQREQSVWRASQAEALRASFSTGVDQPWQTLVNQATALKQTIDASLI
ncbi:dynamin family protein [Leptolyngbya ohadii]|uniref:dynamin family protein n=1 Tax=Leptolyngbya ohadii TaxID=1962290 RepID=UPI000B5A1A8A|nr:dynamin family protein [Leptolyngbya ohadii]